MGMKTALVLLSISGLFLTILLCDSNAASCKSTGHFIMILRVLSCTVHTVFYAEVNCQCTPVGSNNEMKSTAAAVRTPRIYLNTAYPATCSGTVERWRLCFYRPAAHEDGDKYRLTLAVYRRNNTQYEIVESSLRTITSTFPLQSSDFSCQYINLNTADQFNIETGDIIGACIFEPVLPRIERMDIVSEANGHSLMQINDNNIRCGWKSIPLTISNSQLATAGSRLLHLSATITSKFCVYIFPVDAIVVHLDPIHIFLPLLLLQLQCPQLNNLHQ